MYVAANIPEVFLFVVLAIRMVGNLRKIERNEPGPWNEERRGGISDGSAPWAEAASVQAADLPDGPRTKEEELAEPLIGGADHDA